MEKITHNNLPEAVTYLIARIEQLEKQIKNLSSQDTPDILSVNQAAEFLSLKINTIRIKASRGEIAYIKRGGRLYFNRADLERYLQSGRHPAKYEIYENPTKYLGTPKRKK